MKTSRFTENQIINILKQAETGTPVPELCREHGMSLASFYKWRRKYGGMDASMMTRMKELENANRRFKKMYAEEKLKVEIISEAMQKALMPSHRREMASAAVRAHGISVSSACATFAISQTCYRYKAKLSEDNERVTDW